MIFLKSRALHYNYASFNVVSLETIVNSTAVVVTKFRSQTLAGMLVNV